MLRADDDDEDDEEEDVPEPAELRASGRGERRTAAGRATKAEDWGGVAGAGAKACVAASVVRRRAAGAIFMVVRVGLWPRPADTYLLCIASYASILRHWIFPSESPHFPSLACEALLVLCYAYYSYDAYYLLASMDSMNTSYA
jgi:hypothetical protein